MRHVELNKSELKKMNEFLDMWKIKNQEKREEFHHALKYMKLLATRKEKDRVIYTKLTNVSRSGMSRSIELYVTNGSEINRITYTASVIMQDKIDTRNGGIKTYGCGMDMGFNLVYNLGYRIARILDIKGSREDGGYYFRQEWI